MMGGLSACGGICIGYANILQDMLKGPCLKVEIMIYIKRADGACIYAIVYEENGRVLGLGPPGLDR